MPPPSSFVLFANDKDGVVGVWRRRIVLQVRRQTLPLPLLHRLHHELVALAESAMPVGALMVIEAGARMLPEEVRAAQRVMVDEVAAFPNVRLAPVILGDDIPSTMNRTAGRVLALGNPRVRRFTDLAPAAAWLALELETLGASFTAVDLVTAIEQLRELPEAPSRR